MIAIFIDSLQRAQFFLRVAAPLRSRVDFLFFTGEPIAYLEIKRAGFKVRYLTRKDSTRGDNRVLFERLAQQSIEYLTGDISPPVVLRDVASAYACIRSTVEQLKCDKFVIWNGQQILGRAATRVASDLNISTTYIEISNLPNKLFVDSDGVNANSRVAHNPAILDPLPPVSQNEHARWMETYERYKSAPPPQASTSLTKKAKSGLNYVLKPVSGGLFRRRVRSLRMKNSAIDCIELGELNNEILRGKNYTFLALQVSDDTQLKLHSTIGNIEAIRIAKSLAEREGRELVVKPHPAEANPKALREISALKEQLHYHLVRDNTTLLIKNSANVVTINSTVGLEAMLYGKRVVCLGSSYYKTFTEQQLLKFIHHYLVDGVDYFSQTPIDASIAARVIGLETSQSSFVRNEEKSIHPTSR